MILEQLESKSPKMRHDPILRVEVSNSTFTDRTSELCDWLIQEFEREQKEAGDAESRHPD